MHEKAHHQRFPQQQSQQQRRFQQLAPATAEHEREDREPNEYFGGDSTTFLG
jgi:hypothetical protein